MRLGSPSYNLRHRIVRKGLVYRFFMLPFGPFLVALLMGSVLAGCSSPGAHEEVNRRGSNLQSLAGMYRMFTSENSGRPPVSDAEFKEFIQAQGLEHFAAFGIDTIEDLFTSPRDGQPYVVVYGGRELPDVVAYERSGTETGRWIVSSMTVVAEVDEATFRQMVPQ